MSGAGPRSRGSRPTSRPLLSDWGWSVERGHGIDPVTGHGLIDSQRAGIEVFKTLPADAPPKFVEAVWHTEHYVLAGLRTHRGPILVVANWAGYLPRLARDPEPHGEPHEGLASSTGPSGAPTSPTSGPWRSLTSGSARSHTPTSANAVAESPSTRVGPRWRRKLRDEKAIIRCLRRRVESGTHNEPSSMTSSLTRSASINKGHIAERAPRRDGVWRASRRPTRRSPGSSRPALRST